MEGSAYARKAALDDLIDTAALINGLDSVLHQGLTGQWGAAHWEAWWPAGHDFRPLSGRHDADDLAAQKLVMSARLFGEVDVTDLIEALASVAERWGERLPRDPAEVFRADKRKAGSFSLLAAQTYLGHLSSAQFVMTVGALGELALFGALLPTHHALRTPTTGLTDLYPNARFFRSLSAVDGLRVGEMSTSELQDAVCDRLSWPSMSRVASAEHGVMEPAGASWQQRLYARAQTIRLQYPDAFINLGVWDDWRRPGHDPSVAPAAAYEFWTEFSHPVIELEDVTWIHRDRSRVRELLLDAAVHSYLRSLMLSKTGRVRVPVSETVIAREAIVEGLREWSLGVGLRNPRVDVEMIPPHLARRSIPAAN